MDGLFDIVVLISVQAALIYILIMDESISTGPGVLIISLISLASTPIQHLIYDRYSAYARWISEEHARGVQRREG